jgi:hypothetical protein
MTVIEDGIATLYPEKAENPAKIAGLHQTRSSERKA